MRNNKGALLSNVDPQDVSTDSSDDYSAQKSTVVLDILERLETGIKEQAREVESRVGKNGSKKTASKKAKSGDDPTQPKLR